MYKEPAFASQIVEARCTRNEALRVKSSLSKVKSCLNTTLSPENRKIIRPNVPQLGMSQSQLHEVNIANKTLYSKLSKIFHGDYQSAIKINRHSKRKVINLSHHSRER